MTTTSSMKTLPILARITKIVGISVIAGIAMGTSSCISHSEKEFKAQHGFKRSDYFGDKNLNYVPRGVRKVKESRYPQYEEVSAAGFETK
jgi:hypothetical protein